ncbi:MAG: site-2 protease family protein [Pirellulales bacterium]
MFAVEPPPSQADLHFRVLGFPVRVSPWFWGVTVFMALNGGEKVDPKDVLVWVGVVFVSILVHELGHAVLQRRFGGRPRIVLYGFGGLAISDDRDRSPQSQILISLAGPTAGFLFAAIVLAGCYLAGHSVFPVHDMNKTSIERWLAEFQNGVWFFDVPGFTFGFEGFESFWANLAMRDLLYVNIWWGLVNLLPIYPLDGGRVSRELFTLNQPRQGIIQSLWLSAVVAAAFAVFGLARGSIFTAIMFGYLAYANYQNIQAYDRQWG